MNEKDIRCALCAKMPETEEPAILALGRYAKPRYICEICEAEIDTATLSKNYDEAVSAIESLGEKMLGFGKDDPITVDAIKNILERASKRAAAIKDGTYDFSLDDEDPSSEEEESFDEIPEELQETEEDKALDAKDAESAKKFDKVLNWLWVAVFGVAAVVIVLRMFGVL